MKEVLALIEKRKQEFAQLPFFQYLQDKSIAPRQRLAWAPCVAPFAMGFGELNKYFLRDNNSDNPIQKIINRHTHEDARHWLWYLEDIKQLNFDKSVSFSESLKFLWGEETRIPRQAIYELYHYSFTAKPIMKLVIIESIEATGNVASSMIAPISHEIKAATTKEYLYFGDVHLSVETGHTIGTENLDEIIKDIHLKDEEHNEAFELVEKIFEIFTRLTNAFLEYANKHSCDRPFITSSEVDASTITA